MVQTSAGPIVTALDYHDGYLAAMGGAHRKPVPQLGTPAISHHIGYRAPHGMERRMWVAAVEQFCWRLWAGLQEKCGRGDCWSPNAERNLLHLFDKTYEPDENVRGAWKPARPDLQIAEDHHRVVVFSCIWKTLPVSLSIELHTEYFTLTAYIDLSTQRNDGSLLNETEPGTSRDLCCYVRQLSRLLSRYEADLGSWARNDADKYRRLRGAFRKVMWRSYDQIYLRVWHELYHDLFEPAFARVRPRIDEKTVFADFRGFVFTSTEPGEQSAAEPGRHKAYMKEPGWNPWPRRLSDDIGTGFFRDNRVTQQTVETIWPFLTSDPAFRDDASGQPFRGRKTEYTISRFLGNRYLYATALGPQVPNDERPLCYLVIAASGHRWQTGRLLDRINHLGSVRLAALWDLRVVVKASDNLRAAEELFQNVSSKLAGLPTQEEHRNILAEIREEFGTAINLLATAAALSADHSPSAAVPPVPSRGGIEDQSRSSAVREGLDYRIERSRYYSKQFRDGVEILRIRRIEGFQPYDQFVLQRLASSYEFIDMVGLRHQRLRELATSVNQQILAERQHMVQLSIKEIQAVAEIVFFAVLFPYYLGSVLKTSEHYKYVPWLTSEARLFTTTFVIGLLFAIVFPARHGPLLAASLRRILGSLGALGRLLVVLAKALLALAKGLLVGAFIAFAILLSMVLTHCLIARLSP